MAQPQDKRELKETVPEEALTLDSLDKDFKSIILNMLKELKGTIYKELKKIKRLILIRQRLSISR